MFTVVFIVRDEEQRLARAIASLGTVPEVVVCDTGSQDRTVEVARAASARIVHFPWCDDFAAARTYAAAQASHDWVVRFDADEILAVTDPSTAATWLATSIAEAADNGADRLFVLRRYSAHNLHWFPRCYLRTAFSWQHPVHELLEPRRPRIGIDVALDGAVVEHDRDDRPRRYRAILEKAVNSSPDDPHSLYYLGAQCFEEGDLTAAEHWISRYLEGPPGYRYHHSEALSMRGRCRAARGATTLAFADFDSAAAMGPRAEPLLFAARLALSMGDRRAATALALRGRDLPMPTERQPFGGWHHPYLLDRSAYDSAIWEALLRDCSLE
jgi:glycosyltransferase involved in cell wall biosynthesis